MKFTFVHPPFKNYAVVSPPLGLAYLSAVLKRLSIEVSVIDANAERLSVEKIVQKILDIRPDVLGITMTSPQANISLEIIRRIKSKLDIPIMVGGPHPTVMEEELAKDHGIDILVRSEAEETIAELYKYFKGLKPLSSIKGISFKEHNKLIRNPDRPLINDLDSIPFPAWELFPLGRYNSIAGKKNFSLPIMSSRGCPYDCIFCYKGVFGRAYRVRTPQNVIDEILYLVNNFKIDEFVILDDNFALDNDRAIEICDRIINSRIKMPWRLANSIAVRSSSRKLFLKLKEAGCYQIAVGVESGNQKRARNRHHTPL